jgi:hypothetical protein
VPEKLLYLSVSLQADANVKLENEIQRCQKVGLCVSFLAPHSQPPHFLAPQELCASVALHTSNEEDILLRAITVINEKKQRLRRVKGQLAEVQNDFKVFKERTAAAAAAAAATRACAPLKKRPRISCSADDQGRNGQSETLTEISNGTQTLDSLPPKGPSSAAGERNSTVSSTRHNAASAEPRAAAAVSGASAHEPAQFFSQSSQLSVSTQDLTKNFPWANLGL